MKCTKCGKHVVILTLMYGGQELCTKCFQETKYLKPMRWDKKHHGLKYE